ncbi:MAG: hypothetical protein ISS45_01875 [Candidatus Omnitrophica bacterium]|nr:hypothetical protein [Candidatus Omnitrophota bacterium]
MDSLTITIIFIILSTLIGAFIKGRMRDRCLLDFAGYLVNVELKDAKTIWGVLQIESTGLELKYEEAYLDKADNHIETSFILYKNEYSNIHCISRFLDELDSKERKKRDRLLKHILSRKGLITLKRKIRNFFATVRDSVLEVANLLMGRVKQAAPVGRVLAGQDKYVSQIQTEAFSALNTSYEPLLEKYLGKKVILKLSRGGKMIEYAGILKGYTAEFLELMDVDYSLSDQKEVHKADIIIPRSVGLIRHLGE